MAKREYEAASLSQVALKYIEDKILYGVYKSGDRVNEYAIAEELGMSRAPVREAIRKLQMSGLLDFIPRKGNRVVNMTTHDIDEIFDIRIGMEKDVFAILINNKIITPSVISVLEEKANHMFNMANKHDDEIHKIYTLNQLDLDFHGYLWRLANSPRREKMLRDLFIQLLAAMNKDTNTLGKIEEKAKEHFELIQVFKGGDLAVAYTELENHVNQYRTELFSVLQ